MRQLMDDFIHQCQILTFLPQHILRMDTFDHQFEDDVEYWIQFNLLYTAEWTNGSICVIMNDENKKKEFSYFGHEYVVLKMMENSKSKDFINKVNNLHLLYWLLIHIILIIQLITFF